MKLTRTMALLLLLPIMSIGIADNPKTPGDPPDDPPSCCGEGYTIQPTFTVSNPKTGSTVYGEKTDVQISHGTQNVGGQTLCFQYTPGAPADTNAWEFDMSGGDDGDVCVSDEDSNVAVLPPKGVDSTKTYDGDAPGRIIEYDPPTPPRFKFMPPEPSDDEPCKSYTLYAKSDEGSSECNASPGETKQSDNVTLKVWKCVDRLPETVGFLRIVTWVIDDDTESWVLHTFVWGVTVNVDYTECNGDISAYSSFATYTEPDSSQFDYATSLYHKYVIDSTPKQDRGGAGYAFCSAAVCMPEGWQASDPASFTYSESQLGVLSNCNIAGTVYDGGDMLVTKTTDIQVAMPSVRCCGP